MNVSRIALPIAALTLGLLATPARADAGGSCHFHGSKPAAEATVLGCAAQRKDKLVKDGKLDATWQPLKHDKAELVDGKKGNKEWKVSFKHPAPKDPAQATLYMFFTPTGNFIAANFSGQ
jgi:Family of unknown function (DUF6488)